MRYTRGKAINSIVGLCAVAGVIALLAIVGGRATRVSADETPTAADFGADSPDESTPTAGVLYPVTINRPSGPPVVRVLTSEGEPVTLACSTCHDVREPNLANAGSADLDQFHQVIGGVIGGVGGGVGGGDVGGGLDGETPFAHGGLSCLSCHNPDDYDTLRLADGRGVDFTDVMTLCAQCHGRQKRSYDHGAHGGMNGYWDLTRGPRFRNNCIDCHLPHAPAFPRMQPTFKPRDRFLEAAGHD